MSELGTLLLRAREARGLTLEDAERDTRISRRYLQALETEQFEAIPAPVYARGFLRSYSQYLGLDPVRMLEMFPRQDDLGSAYQREPQQRASPENPISVVGASRPSWRRPHAQPPSPAPRGEPVGQARAPVRQTRPDRAIGDDEEMPPYPPPRGATRAQSPGYREPRAQLPAEPMIGIDIGVPAPTRRIKPDPAAPARTLAVVGVAAAAILAVIIIAFLLSRAGGSGSGVVLPTPTSAAAFGANPSVSSPSPSATTTAGGAAPGTQVQVPNVLNLQQSAAESAITRAGLKAQVTRQSATQPAGTVINQAPSGGSPALSGDTVYLVVSSGQ